MKKGQLFRGNPEGGRFQRRVSRNGAKTQRRKGAYGREGQRFFFATKTRRHKAACGRETLRNIHSREEGKFLLTRLFTYRLIALPAKFFLAMAQRHYAACGREGGNGMYSRKEGKAGSFC